MKNKQIIRIALCMLCYLGATFFMKADPDPNFHIYLCFGQSNMEGNASVPNSEKEGVDERFQMLYTADDCSRGDRKKGQWYTAIPPLARCFHDNNIGFGPVDYFGRTLVAELDPSIRVGVVVVACGGSDIALFEKDKCENYIRTAADWLQSYARAYGNNPYKRLMEMGKEAQKVGVIKGILIHQGENNNEQEDWPVRLKGVYENMLNDLGLNAAEVPLLVVEVRHSGPCSGHNRIIANVPNVIPTAYVVSSEGCEAAFDQYHFTVEGYKELGRHYAQKMLELLGDNPVQQSALSLSTILNQESEPGEVSITVNYDAEVIQRVEIYADNERIAEGDSYVWENILEGSHSIWAVGYDSDNKEYTTPKKTIKILPEQKPYNGTPAKIPGIIEAEEFDYGGEGNAYHDNDEQNHNGGDRNEGVDMNNTAIGYLQTGEWLEYTVEVEKDGEYEVECRVASKGTSGSFTLYMDNTFIIPGDDGTPGGFVKVPNTGDYESFETVTVKLNKLTKGKHVLKLEITGDWFDLDNLKFNLIQEDTNVDLTFSDLNEIPAGDYYVFDILGRYIKIITINRNNSEQLNSGFYILKNDKGNSYTLLISNNK